MKTPHVGHRKLGESFMATNLGGGVEQNKQLRKETLYTLTSPRIMRVATKVHVLRRYTMLAWIHDTIELVQHATLWNNTKVNIAMMIVMTT